MTKDELIAALEAAEGPSRELDRDIGLLLGIYEGWEDLGCFTDPAAACHAGQGFAAPHYTASIDAALTLVPEGWCVELHWAAGEPNATCRLTGPSEAHFREQIGLAFAPALALCIASLKARG